MSDDLSAFEKERLDRMKRNRAVLEDLGLAGGSSAVLGIEAPRKKVRRAPVAPAPPREPERRSARLVGAKPPDFYVAWESASGDIVLGGEVEKAKRWMREHRFGDETRARAAADNPDDPMAVMPRGPEDLLEGEQAAFQAVRAAKTAKARELDTAGYHIAQIRALCELVRRLPANKAELEECWGFGPSKVDAYGDYFLEALRPFVDDIRQAQATASAAAAAAAAVEDDEEAPPGQQRTRGRDVAALRDGETGVLEVDEEDDEEEEAVAVLSETVREAGAGQAALLPYGPDDLHRHEQPAFEALREWKRARARELGYNDPCVICHNRTLCEIVRLLPASPKQLLGVWGMGPRRVAQHGALMLAALEPLRPALLAGRRQSAAPPAAPAEPWAAKRSQGVEAVEGGPKADADAAGRAAKVAAAVAEVAAAGPTCPRTPAHAAVLSRTRLPPTSPHSPTPTSPKPPHPTPPRAPPTSPRSPTAAEAATGDETDEQPRRSSRLRATSGKLGGSEAGNRGSAGSADGARARPGGRPHVEWERLAEVLPSGPWHERRGWCAATHGCRACKEYSAAGTAFRWAGLSQRVLDILASSRTYGSHEKAAAAGWRWHAAPNRNARSHNHQWWPPQDVADAYDAAHGGEKLKMPLGTTKVTELLCWLF